MQAAVRASVVCMVVCRRTAVCQRVYIRTTNVEFYRVSVVQLQVSE